MSRTNDRRFLFDARVAARGGHAADKLRKRGENAVKMKFAQGPGPADSFNNKSAFYMDELKIWNFAKREFSVAL